MLSFTPAQFIALIAGADDQPSNKKSAFWLG
jgi:hypothetical protein